MTFHNGDTSSWGGEPLQKMQQLPKIGDWVQIIWTAERSATKQGEVLWTDGKQLLARQSNGKKFAAQVADATVRERDGPAKGGGMIEDALHDDYEDDEYITGSACLWCCGDGMDENEDPIQCGPEKYLKCPSCGGSGKRKDMTLW